MLDLAKFFDLQYLFAPYAGSPLSWPFKITLLAVFLLSIAVAIIAAWKRSRASGLYKKGWRKVQVWGWSNGLVGLLLIAFREARAAYLGSRVWLLLWLLIALIWLITVIRYWRWTIPAKNKELRKQEEFQKWLPKASN